jgi:hypothetical protein
MQMGNSLANNGVMVTLKILIKMQFNLFIGQTRLKWSPMLLVKNGI